MCVLYENHETARPSSSYAVLIDIAIYLDSHCSYFSSLRKELLGNSFSLSTLSRGLERNGSVILFSSVEGTPTRVGVATLSNVGAPAANKHELHRTLHGTKLDSNGEHDLLVIGNGVIEPVCHKILYRYPILGIETPARL